MPKKSAAAPIVDEHTLPAQTDKPRKITTLPNRRTLSPAFQDDRKTTAMVSTTKAPAPFPSEEAHDISALQENNNGNAVTRQNDIYRSRCVGPEVVTGSTTLCC
ncbi:hypothetical protein MRX96_042612 [Rhipicephalus microplus]